MAFLKKKNYIFFCKVCGNPDIATMLIKGLLVDCGFFIIRAECILVRVTRRTNTGTESWRDVL